MAGKNSSILVGREQKTLTYTQLKNYIMAERGIATTADYNKLYDRMRNKVRNYERLTGNEIGNVTEWLYRVTRDQANDRTTDLTRQYRLVEQSSSQSTGKSIEAFKPTFDERIDDIVKEDFAGLIERDDVSKELTKQYHGAELKKKLNERAKKIKDYKKEHDDAQDDDSPIADTAYDYSEV